MSKTLSEQDRQYYKELAQETRSLLMQLRDHPDFYERHKLWERLQRIDAERLRLVQF